MYSAFERNEFAGWSGVDRRSMDNLCEFCMPLHKHNQHVPRKGKVRLWSGCWMVRHRAQDVPAG